MIRVPSEVERWRIRPRSRPISGQDRDLRGERFRRRDADLRAGVHVNAAIAFARDRAGDVVANAEGAIAFAPAFAQRAERVGRLAALADREDEGVARHRRVAVAKLAGVFHFRRNLGELLDQDIRRSCAACSAVPQPVRTTRPTSRNCAGVMFNPPSLAVHSSG